MRLSLQIAQLVFTIILAFVYAEAWLEIDMFEFKRPFVYRQFVPLVARLIMFLTGLPTGVSIALVVILCAVGFVFAARSLYRSFHG